MKKAEHRRTDAETPILWPPNAKNWLIGKYPDAGKEWRWEEKERTEDEMGGWHQTQWTWVWVIFGSWWWTEWSDMFQSIKSQRVRHDWVTELTDWLKTRKQSKCPLTEECIKKWYVHFQSSVQFYLTPWTTAHHASLSFTISRTLLKFLYMESRIYVYTHIQP